jgi:hypothetical protein
VSSAILVLECRFQCLREKKENKTQGGEESFPCNLNKLFLAMLWRRADLAGLTLDFFVAFVVLGNSELHCAVGGWTSG